MTNSDIKKLKELCDLRLDVTDAVDICSGSEEVNLLPISIGPPFHCQKFDADDALRDILTRALCEYKDHIESEILELMGDIADQECVNGCDEEEN